jgi:hypothetical protein
MIYIHSNDSFTMSRELYSIYEKYFNLITETAPEYLGLCRHSDGTRSIKNSGSVLAKHAVARSST